MSLLEVIQLVISLICISGIVALFAGNDEDWAPYIALFCIFALLFMCLSYNLGLEHGRADAVKAGAAEYVVKPDKDGKLKTEFRYKAADSVLERSAP